MLLGRLAWRRFLNRSSRRRPNPSGGGSRSKRRGTLPKRRPKGVLLALVAVLFLFQSTLFSGRTIARLHEVVVTGAADEVAFIDVNFFCYKDLERADQDLVALRVREDASEAERAELERERLEKLRERLTHALAPREPGEPGAAADLTPDEEAELARRVDDMVLRLQRDGIRGFKCDAFDGPLAFLEWPIADVQRRFIVACAAFMLLLWLAVFLASMGVGDKNLGSVAWSMEWLYTLPVSGPTLAASRVLECSLINPLGWLTALPFLGVLGVIGGLGAWVIPMALAGTLAFNATTGAARVVTETWVRLRLAPAAIKNLQALFTLLGSVLLFLLLFLGMVEETPAWIERAIVGLPELLAWLPWAWPLHLARPDLGTTSVILGGVGVLVAGVLAGVLGASLTGRLLRNGLMIGGGAFQGSRAAGGVRSSSGLVRGIPGKDLRLLWRDRSSLVQTLVIPAFIIGIQVLINPGIIRGAAENPGHGAMLAFGIGAYVLMFGGFSVLAAEGQSLWLLYTFPVGVVKMLRQKVRLWAAVSAGYVLAILLLLWVPMGSVDGESLWRGGLALLAILIYSYLGVALATLGHDPSRDDQRKQRPAVAYLYMLLATMGGYVLYNGGPVQVVQFLFMAGFLAHALWQKVERAFPYILDPTDLPPAQVTLADGLVAVALFFLLQMVVLGISGSVRPDVVTLAFAAAGLLTVVIMSINMSLRGLSMGSMSGRETKPRMGSLRAVALSVVAGGLVGGAGLVYLSLVRMIPGVEDLLDGGSFADWADEDVRIYLLLLGVVLAPACEEPIFRGMVYRGLRATHGVRTSVLVSAGIFAMVHPVVSMVPVFVLGVVAALIYERTRSLAAAILVHAVYNAVVLLPA